jgi:hypothetical protein
MSQREHSVIFKKYPVEHEVHGEGTPVHKVQETSQIVHTFEFK